jgi:hypothetical protein
MQFANKEYASYTVSAEESGLNYPVTVVIMLPEGKGTPVAKITPLRAVEPVNDLDEHITWEDAAWQ